uniref:C2H2-type domain-containing protein n=1 Tax=Labrus bergylta TaxID=56723 RepID=A0A3Q3KZT4_9LABR
MLSCLARPSWSESLASRFSCTFSISKTASSTTCILSSVSEIRSSASSILLLRLQNQTEENREAETGADGEDCGGAEPERDSDPERHLQPEIEVKTEDSSEPETDDRDNDWKEPREHQSGLDSVGYLKKRLKIDKKSNSCNECGKIFKNKRDLTQHIRIHTREKPFSCSDCGRRFNYKPTLKFHTAHHRGDKPFSCSVCDRRFCWPSQLKSHKCVGGTSQGAFKLSFLFRKVPN